MERKLANGQFAPRFCGDPNCSGELVADVEARWFGGPQRPILRCDGLTHVSDYGPLVACKVSFPAITKATTETPNDAR